MELGDAVERGAKILGVKPCEGCKRRKEVLNTISRRGVIGGGLAVLLLAKNTLLKGAWKIAGAEIPLDLPSVLGFIRTANSVQRVASIGNETFLSKEDMLLGVASHKEHFSPTNPGYAWMSRFRLAADEVLPGWTLDFDWNRNSYRFVLRGTQYTFITDETGGIYRAQTPQTAPTAKRIQRAADFPSAVGLGALMSGDVPPPTAWERIKDFFTPRSVYAQLAAAKTLQVAMVAAAPIA